jgi:hypothetical protein
MCCLVGPCTPADWDLRVLVDILLDTRPKRTQLLSTEGLRLPNGLPNTATRLPAEASVTSSSLTALYAAPSDMIAEYSCEGKDALTIVPASAQAGAMPSDVTSQPTCQASGPCRSSELATCAQLHRTLWAS